MAEIVGWYVSVDGQMRSGVYLDELEAVKVMHELRVNLPGCMVYINPITVRVPDGSVETKFGYKYHKPVQPEFQGTWHMDRYEGMGNVSYFQMNDTEALQFAEAVYSATGRIPGKLIDEYVESLLSDIEESVRNIRGRIHGLD